MGALEDVYTAQWFAHDFAELQPEFDVVADSLVRQFGDACEDVMDVGCGPGMVVKRLRDRGRCAWGLEGSLAGIEYGKKNVDPMIDSWVDHFDIREQDRFYHAVGFVICTEVAEHLDEKDAPGLVRLLCTGLCPIVFTAAPPGQDGHHHVNCQEPRYWIEMFARHGVTLDEVATVQLRRRWSTLSRLSHMYKNLMVFT